MSNVSLVQTNEARGVSAVTIARLLEGRIRSGEYATGTQLPTVRKLAQELGVNKNTVVRAYRTLEHQGFLEVTQGRGAFVRQAEPDDSLILNRWRGQLEQVVQEAQQQGLSHKDVLYEAQRIVTQVYGTGRLRASFVECNQPDIHDMGHLLSEAVSHPLEGVLLADLVAHPQELASKYDLIITTFVHLSEVSRALSPQDREKLVGVHAMPTHDSLLKLARLHAAVVGLVCEFPTTLDTLSHIVQMYHPTATVVAALMDDRVRLQTLLGKADAIVVSRSAAPRLAELKPIAPVITVTFTIDQQSIEFLRSRIGQALNAEG